MHAFEAQNEVSSNVLHIVESEHLGTILEGVGEVRAYINRK